MTEPLILHYNKLSKQVAQLFADISSKPQRRKRFIDDPGSEIIRALKPRIPIKSSRIGQANRGFFAFLSNPGFIGWAKTSQAAFEADAQKAYPDLPLHAAIRKHAAALGRQHFVEQLMTAFRQFADRELLVSIFGLSHDVPSWIEDYINNKDVDPSMTAAAVMDRILNELEELDQKLKDLMNQENVLFLKEIVFFFIAAAAIFLLLTQVDLTPVAPKEMISRVDLQRLTALVANRLEAHAFELRRTGHLAKPYNI